MTLVLKAANNLLTVPDVLFMKPLRALYFGGPRIMGWGGWEGIAPHEICAQLTQVPASVWIESASACGDLLERKFQTIAIGISSLAYILLIWKIFSYVWFRYFVMGPLLKELKMWVQSPVQNPVQKIEKESNS